MCVCFEGLAGASCLIRENEYTILYIQAEMSKKILGIEVAVLVMIFSLVSCNSKSTLKENSSQTTSEVAEIKLPPHPCSAIEDFVEREICLSKSSIDTFNHKLASGNLSSTEQEFIKQLIAENESKITRFQNMDENERKIFSEIYSNAMQASKANE